MRLLEAGQTSPKPSNASLHSDGVAHNCLVIPPGLSACLWGGSRLFPSASLSTRRMRSWKIFAQTGSHYPPKNRFGLPHGMVQSVIKIWATSVAVVVLVNIFLVNFEKRSVIAVMSLLPNFVFGKGPRMSIATNFRGSSGGNSCKQSWFSEACPCCRHFWNCST